MNTFYGFYFQHNFRIQPLLTFYHGHDSVPSLSSLLLLILLLLPAPPYSVIHTEVKGILKLLLNWACLLLNALQWLPSQTRSQTSTRPSLLWSPPPTVLFVSLHSICVTNWSPSLSQITQASLYFRSFVLVLLFASDIFLTKSHVTWFSILLGVFVYKQLALERPFLSILYKLAAANLNVPYSAFPYFMFHHRSYLSTTYNICISLIAYCLVMMI